MRIEHAEIIAISLPLVSPFRTSFGTSHTRETFLLRVVTDEAEGWAECGAEPEPLYSSEFLGAAETVIAQELWPRLIASPTPRPERLASVTGAVKGHRMAKHVVETALLDADLRARGMSFAHYLGSVRERVPVGVSVGIMDTVAQLLDAIAGYLEAGYQRIKLKIEPGWDVDVVRTVRETFGYDVPLQVDANTAYTLADARHLARLDEFQLLLIEQPFAEDDLLGHAALARRLETPVCLDESITSARAAATAISLEACSVINIKPARVGGYLESRRIHDLATAHGLPVWCGGMLETGLGRAANCALAGLPGFSLPGDTSASRRYYHEDITPPFELVAGHLQIPTGPGLGVEPDPAILRKYAVRTTPLPCA